MRYLALGDSFTIGTGTTPDRSFPAVLAALWAKDGLDCDLRNPAVNGYTTDDLIRDELPLVESFRPDLVTVLIGANDVVAAFVERAVFTTRAEERYRLQLRRIHDRIASGAPHARRFALPQPDWSLTPTGSSFGDPADVARAIERTNAIAREECERAGGAYADIFPLMREQMRKRMTAPDGLHPSAEAYAEWAAALREALRAS
ncbi:MAG TPA: SGNH/GDSL hydrolase family protein [Candidatus Limnocylindria bacterium]|nr:SGNH/GDSL hydrolase family protein [Candidatus Limnocylindria bacterium]